VRSCYKPAGPALSSVIHAPINGASVVAELTVTAMVDTPACSEALGVLSRMIAAGNRQPNEIRISSGDGPGRIGMVAAGCTLFQWHDGAPTWTAVANVGAFGLQRHASGGVAERRSHRARGVAEVSASGMSLAQHSSIAEDNPESTKDPGPWRTAFIEQAQNLHGDVLRYAQQNREITRA
jgi:hypothetical protein